MFDIGATELLVIAVVMILVVGPKELPGMLRNIGRMVKKVRGMASDFQSQFDDALKEAELDGIQDAVKDVKSMNPMASLKNELNPINQMMEETKTDLNKEVGEVNTSIASTEVEPKEASANKPVPKKEAPKKEAPKKDAPKKAAEKATDKPAVKSVAKTKPKPKPKPKPKIENKGNSK